MVQFSPFLAPFVLLKFKSAASEAQWFGAPADRCSFTFLSRRGPSTDEDRTRCTRDLIILKLDEIGFDIHPRQHGTREMCRPRAKRSFKMTRRTLTTDSTFSESGSSMKQ